MIGLLLAMLAPQAAADTVTIQLDEALRLGVEQSRVLTAARARADAARDRTAQARAWPNPTLAASVENLGQQEAFTGVDGTRGLEGQLVLSSALPLGPERSGSIERAEGYRRAAEAGADLALHRASAELLDLLGAYLTDQAAVRTAAEELATLEALADALVAQAAEGRASEGDAARASLARGMAATRLARRASDVSRGQAELATVLGLDPGTPFVVVAPSCSTPGTDAGVSASTEAAGPPELRVASAGVEAARGATRIARGIRAPDVRADLGLRRTGVQTGLYVGLAVGLPLFDRGARAVSAALSEEDAASAELEETRRVWRAERVGRARALEALALAGERFDAAWFEDLDRVVEAADARFAAGEGTLFELLDSRRARLQALDDYHLWQADWWRARVALARAEGTAPSAALLCTDPYRETR